MEIAFYPEPGWDTQFVEFLWCEPVGDMTFRVVTVPCYVDGISNDDVIRAGDDPELHFETLVAQSGHSTLRVVFSEGANEAAYEAPLARLGCRLIPRDGGRAFVLDVPGQTSITDVLDLIADGQEQDDCDWTSGSISQIHGAQLRAVMDAENLPDWVPRASKPS